MAELVNMFVFEKGSDLLVKGSVGANDDDWVKSSDFVNLLEKLKSLVWENPSVFENAFVLENLSEFEKVLEFENEWDELNSFESVNFSEIEKGCVLLNSFELENL